MGTFFLSIDVPSINKTEVTNSWLHCATRKYYSANLEWLSKPNDRKVRISVLCERRNEIPLLSFEPQPLNDRKGGAFGKFPGAKYQRQPRETETYWEEWITVRKTVGAMARFALWRFDALLDHLA
ncbi:hypothetical protein IWQ55_000425 [Labrenzia sp. EL_208]|nr:hypothetical protein [Labrenzia sp. EL_132]MBG6227233.1 hypothetical protein [Labrenzia sp. EL_208]